MQYVDELSNKDKISKIMKYVQIFITFDNPKG